MDDIVDRLRDENRMADSALSTNERADAADEIERLRTALQDATAMLREADRLDKERTGIFIVSGWYPSEQGA